MTTRWTVGRKRDLLRELEENPERRAEIMREAELSEEELAHWRSADDLRVTRIQQRRAPRHVPADQDRWRI